MALRLWIAPGLLVLLLSGCFGMEFDPYNYETSEDAKLKKDDYSIHLHGRELMLERKIKLKPKRM